jgi:hypothetical protein
MCLLFKININFEALYAPVAYMIAFSLLLSITQYTGALLSSNMTTCINGNCTTTTCINDVPCKTTRSNSSNITSLDDLIQNKTIVPPKMPGEIV